MKKNKILEEKAKVQFLLIITDYVENGSHFYTPEQEEEMILYREQLRQWTYGKAIPTVPSFFPYSALYKYLFF